MYKKLILATAISAVASGAQAATWGSSTAAGPTNAAFTGTVVHNKEGISKYTASAGVQLSSASVVLGASYAVGDEITFSYNVSKATGTNFSSGFRSWAPAAAAKTDLSSDGATVNVSAFTIDDATTDGQDNVQVGDTFTAVDNTAGTAADQVFTVTSIGGAAGALVVTPNITLADNKPIVWGSRAVRYIDFGLANSTATSATYRVTAIEAVGGAKATTVGAVVYSPKIMAQPASLTAAGTATVAFSAATSAGAAFDALATAATIATAKTQDALSVTTKFDAVVDVEQDRKALVGGTATASTDTLVFTNTETAAANGKQADLTTAGVLSTATVTGIAATTDVVTHTINGDFTWADNSSAAGITSTTVISNDATSSVDSIATDGLSVKSIDTTIDSGASTITITKDQAAAVIPNQSYSGTSKKTWASNSIADTETITWAALGAWTLNGASITAYGVPMGSSVSRFLWVNNKGSIPAVTSYTATMNGSSYGPYEVATVPAKSSSSIGGLIDIDLAARGIVIPENSRANINISTPVADGDITVSASYKHIADKDRLSLETSDTTQGATNAAK